MTTDFMTMYGSGRSEERKLITVGEYLYLNGYDYVLKEFFKTNLGLRLFSDTKKKKGEYVRLKITFLLPSKGMMKQISGILTKDPLMGYTMLQTLIIYGKLHSADLTSAEKERRSWNLTEIKASDLEGKVGSDVADTVCGTIVEVTDWPIEQTDQRIIDTYEYLQDQERKREERRAPAPENVEGGARRRKAQRAHRKTARGRGMYGGDEGTHGDSRWYIYEKMNELAHGDPELALRLFLSSYFKFGEQLGDPFYEDITPLLSTDPLVLRENILQRGLPSNLAYFTDNYLNQYVRSPFFEQAEQYLPFYGNIFSMLKGIPSRMSTLSSAKIYDPQIPQTFVLKVRNYVTNEMNNLTDTASKIQALKKLIKLSYEQYARYAHNIFTKRQFLHFQGELQDIARKLLLQDLYSFVNYKFQNSPVLSLAQKILFTAESDSPDIISSLFGELVDLEPSDPRYSEEYVIYNTLFNEPFLMDFIKSEQFLGPLQSVVALGTVNVTVDPTSTSGDVWRVTGTGGSVGGGISSDLGWSEARSIGGDESGDITPETFFRDLNKVRDIILTKYSCDHALRRRDVYRYDFAIIDTLKDLIRIKGTLGAEVSADNFVLLTKLAENSLRSMQLNGLPKRLKEILQGNETLKTRFNAIDINSTLETNTGALKEACFIITSMIHYDDFEILRGLGNELLPENVNGVAYIDNIEGSEVNDSELTRRDGAFQGFNDSQKLIYNKYWISIDMPNFKAGDLMENIHYKARVFIPLILAQHLMFTLNPDDAYNTVFKVNILMITNAFGGVTVNGGSSGGDIGAIVRGSIPPGTMNGGGEIEDFVNQLGQENAIDESVNVWDM